VDGHSQEIFVPRFDVQLGAAATAVIICCRRAAYFGSRLAFGTRIIEGGF
jgi:hypothetical protein